MNSDILDYLLSKGLHPKTASADEVHLACLFHGEDPGKRGRMYVNIDPNASIPGLFHCKVCDERGSIVKIKRHFGDTIDTEKDIPVEHRAAIFRTAAAFYHDKLADHPDVIRWLRRDRGFTLETIMEHQLGFAESSGLYHHLRDAGFEKSHVLATGLVTQRATTTRDFLTNCVTIPYHVLGSVVQIRGRRLEGTYEEDGDKYLTPPGQKSRVYNTDVLHDAERALVCEGEFDALMACQLGYRAVGVPGANVWQDRWNGLFTRVRRVYVVFDNDEEGLKGGHKVRDALGPRCRVVEIPVEEYGEKVDITKLVKEKGVDRLTFDRMLERARGGLLISIDEAFNGWKALDGVTGLHTGFEHLDAILRPGILPGQVMVLLAKTGTGKSIWLLNVAYNILSDPDRKLLLCSLELTSEEIFERLLRIYHFFNLDTTPDECLDFFRGRLMLTDANRMTEDQLIATVEDFRYETGDPPSATMIDYLGYWARSFPGDEYQRISDAIMTGKAIGKDHRMPLIIPHQVNRMAQAGKRVGADSGRGSGVVEETADFELALFKPDDEPGKPAQERDGKVTMEILKSRHGGTGVEIPLQFAPVTLALMQADHSLVSRARQEVVYARQLDSWQTVIRRHRGEFIR